MKTTLPTFRHIQQLNCHRNLTICPINMWCRTLREFRSLGSSRYLDKYCLRHYRRIKNIPRDIPAQHLSNWRPAAASAMRNINIYKTKINQLRSRPILTATEHRTPTELCHFSPFGSVASPGQCLAHCSSSSTVTMSSTAATTATVPASASASHYVVQHLPGRYIRSCVLDDYINSKLDEFGDQWTREVRGLGCDYNQAALCGSGIRTGTDRFLRTRLDMIITLSLC